MARSQSLAESHIAALSLLEAQRNALTRQIGNLNRSLPSIDHTAPIKSSSSSSNSIDSQLQRARQELTQLGAQCDEKAALLEELCSRERLQNTRLSTSARDAESRLETVTKLLNESQQKLAVLQKHATRLVQRGEKSELNLVALLDMEKTMVEKIHEFQAAETGTVSALSELRRSWSQVDPVAPSDVANIIPPAKQQHSIPESTHRDSFHSKLLSLRSFLIKQGCVWSANAEESELVVIADLFNERSHEQRLLLNRWLECLHRLERLDTNGLESNWSASLRSTHLSWTNASAQQSFARFCAVKSQAVREELYPRI
jgi:hypothetical protein